MRTGGLLVQAAVGADYFLKLGRRRAGGGSGLLFGLRLGFLYDPTEASWNMEERKVLGGPDVKSTGPFIRFLLGWGRFDD
jgi:hypothetical protein